MPGRVKAAEPQLMTNYVGYASKTNSTAKEAKAACIINLPAKTAAAGGFLCYSNTPPPEARRLRTEAEAGRQAARQWLEGELLR